jgi:hypothetical protein
MVLFCFRVLHPLEKARKAESNAILAPLCHEINRPPKRPDSLFDERSQGKSDDGASRDFLLAIWSRQNQNRRQFMLIRELVLDGKAYL